MKNPHKKRMGLACIVVATVLLAGCTDTEIQTAVNRCPPLVKYSPAKMKEMAAASRALPPDSPLHALISDYHRTRDAIRLCDQAPGLLQKLNPL